MSDDILGEEALKGGGNASTAAASALSNLVDRIENLEHEKKQIAEDLKAVYEEAKEGGFDTKIIRKVIAIRKRDFDAVKSEMDTLDFYMRALGMI